MNDIMFNTAKPRIVVPTIPVTTPALWKASGMARKPPPIVALTMCISASMFLVRAKRTLCRREPRTIKYAKQVIILNVIR